MELLSVRNLTKRYDGFTLQDVSFSLEAGYIMGFIGRNGAGKTTTLKAMLNLVHPDGGEVFLLGEDFSKNSLAIKQQLGCMLGGADFYPKKSLKVIADVVSRFYDQWDDALFSRYMTQFALDLNKKVDTLSQGMRVKFSLALALSHHARLLILDEPTSGLDPISRDEVIELFQQIIEDGEHSILFSTHITSDLEKCADFVTYIKEGRILRSADKECFLDAYRLVQGRKDQLTGEIAGKLIGEKTHAFGFAGLIHKEDLAAAEGLNVAPADLESIMIYCDKE